MPIALLIVYPGCTQTEVAPLLSLLSTASTLRTLGPTDAPVQTSEGLRIEVDATFDQASLEGAALILVPGGDPAAVMENAALLQLLRSAPTPIAAICNGALLLAAAGVLSGRSITHTAVEKYAPRPEFDALLQAAASLFAGATYLDEDVVVDGPIITAKPWASIAFAKKVATHAGLLQQDLAASRARYLHGHRDSSFGDPHQRWAIFLTPTETQATASDIEAHVAHLRALERRGILTLAGPFAENRADLVVVSAPTRAEAEAIAAADPFVWRGKRSAEVRRWLISSEDNNHLLPHA